MKLLRYILLLNVVLFSRFCAFSEEPLKVLETSESVYANSSFSAVITNQNGDLTRVLQKKSANGSYLVRKEVVTNPVNSPLTNIFILNPDGYWRLLPSIKTALRMDFMYFKTNSPFFGLFENVPIIDTHCAYDLKQEMLDGKNVYLIQKSTIQNGANSEKTQWEFTIGCDDWLIYKYKFSSSGKKTTSGGFSISYASLSIGDDAFRVPEGYFNVVCTNALKFAQLSREAVDAQMKTSSYKADNRSFGYRQFVMQGFLFLVMAISLVAAFCFARRMTKQK